MASSRRSASDHFFGLGAGVGCRAIAPVLESLSEDFAGRATIAKLDIDANQQVAMKYGIRSIPTVMLFDKGEIVDTLIGVRPKPDYERSLQTLL